MSSFTFVSKEFLSEFGFSGEWTVATVGGGFVIVKDFVSLEIEVKGIPSVLLKCGVVDVPSGRT